MFLSSCLKVQHVRLVIYIHNVEDVYVCAAKIFIEVSMLTNYPLATLHIKM